MATSTYYASIAVVELHPGDLVTIESISVTEGECVLSGAWGFNISEDENISNVLSGKMIVPLGEKKELGKLPIKSEMIILDSVPFLIDAKKAAKEALEAYETFKSENLTKRKKLVAPEFYNWPDSINFNESADYLESIGKMATPSGTPDNFKKTLSAARLVKHLVDMWQLDEQERNNRKYVEGEDAKITILPESWLEATSTNRS
jgi:hypothetical protein